MTLSKLPLFCAGAFAWATAQLIAANPIITNVLTADPAALVHNGRVYLYTGHDEALPDKPGYVMKDWLCFSSDDLVHWTQHPTPMSLETFKWAKSDAWAGQVIEKAGKFYWYAPVAHATIPGFAIGVAVADGPTGPFKDARGTALITSDMTESPEHMKKDSKPWDDIDPAVFIDDDGQAYLFWGNTKLKYAKLNANMTELDGPIQNIDIANFTEAPWIHKRDGIYYLSYAVGFPEKTAYSTSKSIHGPWTYGGLLTELAGNCNTNHQAIIEFKGRWYFIYHNGGTPQGGSFRRSVCIDYLNHNPDGSLQRVWQTSEGVGPAR